MPRHANWIDPDEIWNPEKAAAKRAAAPRVVELNARPHKGTAKYPGGQDAWMRAALEFDTVVLAVGRQVGKTTGMQLLALEEGARCDKFYFAAYVAQGHPQAEEFYETMLTTLESGNMVKRHKNKGQDRWIECVPFGRNLGWKLWCWSGEEGAHDGARGKGLHRLMIDEAGFIPQEAYVRSFRPMLVARDGKTLIAGTPLPEGCGFAWFREEFKAGVDGPDKQPGYKSFNVPTESNPHANLAKVARERERVGRLDPIAELAEFDAIFVEDAGGVFTNLEECFRLRVSHEEDYYGGTLWVGEEARPHGLYVMGCDWAKFKDRTVASIFDRETRRQVGLWMCEHTKYDQQLDAVHALSARFSSPLIVADERDAGAYVVERLRWKYGDGVTGVKWTYGGTFDKGAYVTRGRRLCQTGDWGLLDVKPQREEFRLFLKIKLPSGGYRYESPSGKHDDFVSACLLAALHLEIPPTPETEQKIEAPPFGSMSWFEWNARLNPQAQYRD